MALNNDNQDDIIVEQRKRGRQRASCAPQGVVPEHISWPADEYAPLFDVVAQDIDVIETRGRSWRSTTIRTHVITHEDYMRAMQHEADDVMNEASSDMSDASLNRHQRLAEAAADRRMKKYSVRLGGTHGTHRT